MPRPFDLTIVHCSDLHISERLYHEDALHVPRRYGHDPAAFMALDAYLKETEWDVLVISGDLTRIGNLDSFVWARNWLSSTIYIGKYELGLDLANRDDRLCVTVPGNHDRFNGNLRQSALDNYCSEFGALPINEIIRKQIRGTQVNMHLFDSTYAGGSFGRGKVDEAFLTPRTIKEEEVDIAVIHHHIIQPPNVKRNRQLELENCNAVASYMLAMGFDAILFGHLHSKYVDHISGNLIVRTLPDRRSRGRFFRALVPKRFLARYSKDGPVRFRREKTADGKYPTSESYFEYLYMKQRGVNVTSPSRFANVKKFYAHIEENKRDLNLRADIEKLKKKKVLVSLAPSACQAEAPAYGLQKIVIRGLDGIIEKVESRYVGFDGAHFVETESSKCYVLN